MEAGSRRTVLQRVRRALGLALETILYTAIGGFVLLWAWVLFMGFFFWRHDTTDAKPAPSPTLTRVGWYLASQSCADGWVPPSIGERGACSHHGGVVSLYASIPGHLVTMCGPEWRPASLEQAQHLMGFSGLVGCALPERTW